MCANILSVGIFNFYHYIAYAQKYIVLKHIKHIWSYAQETIISTFKNRIENSGKEPSKLEFFFLQDFMWQVLASHLITFVRLLIFRNKMLMKLQTLKRQRMDFFSGLYRHAGRNSTILWMVCSYVVVIGICGVIRHRQQEII